MAGKPSCRSLTLTVVVFTVCTLTITATAFASSDSKRVAARHERARSLFLDACTACHTLERVRIQRLGKEEWRHLIAGMLSEGVPLTDEETSVLVDYLAENFGPDKPGS